MASTQEDNASLYDVYLKSQRQLLDQWQAALAGVQKSLGATDASAVMSESTRQAFRTYEAWKESTGKYLDVLMSACPGNAGTDTFSRVFRAADVYVKLYEFWEPLAAALREKAFDAQSFGGLLDPAKYAETIHRLFGFGAPTAVRGLAGQASEFIETWASRGQEFLKPWAEAMRTSLEAAFASGSGDPQASAEVFRRFYSAFERTLGKSLNMPAVGKDREQVELFGRAVQRYANFATKNNELQRLMAGIAQKAMEKVVQGIAQKVRDGQDIKGFGEFVQLWTKTNEEAFLEFFRTDQYTELQGLVLDAAVDCRKEFQQLMEASLKDFPIALRSEMDDISKTTYTLNKRVRALGKKCAEVDDLHANLEQLQNKVAALECALAGVHSVANAAPGVPRRKADGSQPKRANRDDS
jgi:class III poly(R)-hydroxyalkanoic acid synthase PhaE subunit